MENERQRVPGPELSIVVPTYKERENLEPLVNQFREQLKSIHWEVVFVDDDSPDGTVSQGIALAREDHRVRFIRRVGRRGLSSACVEGMMASSAPYVAVMDADLQHDTSLVPKMLRTLKEDHVDIVIGSRYVAGGDYQSFDAHRLRGSRLATSLSHLLLRETLTDPMSGFFVLRRETVDAVLPRLSGIGFKILLDIMASSPRPLTFRELPYRFNRRLYGESKLDPRVMWEYLMLLGDKLLHGIVPVRFLSFALIGFLGVFFHFSILLVCLKFLALSFVVSQTWAVLSSVALNFTLNNFLTYRDRRLKGWKWWRGLVSFYVVCSLGALTNIAIANYLFHIGIHWSLAAVAGVAVGAVWNYALSSVYTWE